MAEPDHFTGSELLIQVGDGMSPETFAHPCLINAERAFGVNVTSEESVVPDCDDPTAPAWVSRDADSISVDITGQGIMDAASTDEYFQWAVTGAKKNIRVVVASGSPNQRTYGGRAMLETFEISGTRKGKSNASVSIKSDGAFTLIP